MRRLLNQALLLVALAACTAAQDTPRQKAMEELKRPNDRGPAWNDDARERLERSLDQVRSLDWERVIDSATRGMALLTERPPGAVWNFNLAPFAAQPFEAQRDSRRAEGEAGRSYERGQRALDTQQWDEARSQFSEAAARGGSRADGALYWKAYAENKLGRRDDALATIDQLRKTFASSRWLDDAKALEVEVRQASGRPVTPEGAQDEELKLMALNGLMTSDPERALPLLEKLLQSTQSPKVKARALFVLTQSGSPNARKTVVQVAKGGANPDLQMKAVNYLGVMGASQDLGEVYASTSDTTVKRAVLHAFMVSGAREQLLTAAKGEKSPDLRREAIRQLGVSGGMSELWQLYQAETVPEIKREIIRALFVGGNSERLIEIARAAKEPELRREAIRNLGNMGSEHTGDALAAMYAGESDPALRKEIIRALFVQGNARAMVAIARRETDVELKKQIVRDLSNMGSREAADYLMELLK